VLLSGVLKRASAKLTKICNDIRLLASGPRCGVNEINLPQMQPGWSIMPGKVNPVIPEVVNQTGFLVIGMDLTVTLAASAGQPVREPDQPEVRAVVRALMPLGMVNHSFMIPGIVATVVSVVTGLFLAKLMI